MRACNRCRKDVAGDELAFEGSFIDWNYELDLCDDCAIDFKGFVDSFCDVTIDTNTDITDEEKASRNPGSKNWKKLVESRG